MADFSKGAAWMDGAVMPIGDARIGVTDWGVTHSDITYDVVPVWRRGFFRLPDYLDRFEASMAALRLDVGMDRAAITAALHAMVAATPLDDLYCAMVAARGVPLVPGTRDPRDCANHFYAWCVPYVHIVAPDMADRGIAVHVARDVRRIPPDSVNPRAKNYHWGDFTAGLFEAKDAGFETVILLDHAGCVTEGPGFNIFAVTGDRVVTPERGVLQGITRRTAMEMCREAGLPVEARAVPLAEMEAADELFLSSSGGGIIPVTRLGARIFGNGAPGPLSRRLRKAYVARLESPRYRTEITG